MLRLRDSVVRLGEELEQSAQAEARERENARYFQQRLQDMREEMEDLSQREQDSGRRRMELVRDELLCNAIIEKIIMGKSLQV